jgi:hypothetical protein
MQRFGGQAEANTTQMDKLRANAGEPRRRARQARSSPGLNLVAGALSSLIGWLQQNQAILKPIAEFIGIVTAAWIAYLAVFVRGSRPRSPPSGGDGRTRRRHGREPDRHRRRRHRRPRRRVHCRLAALGEVPRHRDRHLERDPVSGGTIWGEIGGTVRAPGT